MSDSQERADRHRLQALEHEASSLRRLIREQSEEVSELRKLISELTMEVRLLAQASSAIQQTLEKREDMAVSLHSHDKRIEANTHHINNLMSYAAKADEGITHLKDREIPDIKQEISTNKSAVNLMKFMASGVVLSGIGLIMNAMFGGK